MNSLGPITDHRSTEGARRRASSRKSRGFTVVEVALAATILAIVIATSVTTIQRSYLSLDTARNLTIAGQILQSEIEKIRVKNWSTVDGYAAGPTTLTIDSAFTSQANIGSRFTLTRSVTTPKTEMKQITLTVAWTSYDRRPLSRSLMTCYAKDGLYDYFYNTK